MVSDILTIAFWHPQMTGLIIWGFWENRHWTPVTAKLNADLT
jgi:hypothetical protein